MRKVIIIGSGPAGYTAAIYASRAGLQPLMIAGLSHGGQLMTTTDVENFPGYKSSIMGPEMMEDIRQQAIRFNTEIIYQDAIDVRNENGIFIVKTYEGNEYKSESLIISTGANAKWLGIESEKKFSGLGVSACATCDGFFYKDMDVIVVGAGDTACEEALYLSNICNHVTMLVRSDKFRSSNIMKERVERKNNITILYNSEIDEILGDKFVEYVRLKNGSIINCKGVFIAIGHKPNSDLFRDLIDLDDDGYIITEKGSSKTNFIGIFACGDVQDKHYRQAVTAAGSGCMAALDCERYLSNKN